MLLPLLPAAVLELFQAAPVSQEPAPATQAPLAVLPLRVEDVARFVLERAPAVRQSHLTALANSGSVQEADGLFDPVFFGDATASYNQSPSPGGFLNAGLTSTHFRTLSANQGVRALLVTGASVSFTVNETYTEDNLPPGFFGINPESRVNMSVAITQPLLRGGWMQPTTQTLQQAEIAFNRGMAELRTTEIQNLQSAVDAFWDLAFAREDVKVKELSLELAEELREVTQARYRVGAAAEVEVVQTDADIAGRTDALLTARNAVRTAEDGLRTLIFNLEEQQEWGLELVPTSEPPAAEPTDLTWEEAFQVALEHRPEMRRLRLDVERARLDWEVASTNLMPKLDLTASGNSSGLNDQIYDAFAPAFGLRAHGYSIGFVLEVALGNNQYRGAERRTWYLLKLAERAERDFEHSLAAEVRDGVRNLNFLAERVRTTARASEVAQRQLEAEQRRLEEGASTNFQVLQFQEDLAQALTAEKGARFAYAKAVTKLRLVQGLNWDGSAPEPLPDAAGLDY